MIDWNLGLKLLEALKLFETGETVISLCTYSVGDPFSMEESETYHMCGRPAVKRALFAPKPDGFGTINYCKRHWTIASQVIQPDVTIEDIDVE